MMILKCDICHREIEDGEEYFEFPDGVIVCTSDWDCLTEYGKKFSHYADYDDGPDPDQQIDEWRDHRE